MSERANDNEYMPPEQLAKVVAENARQFERELLAAKLEAEILDPTTGDEHEQAWRRGWNSRAESLVRELRGGR